MSQPIPMLADHGDAEWVKLIGLAIFAAISIVGSMVKKLAESRKSPTREKTVLAQLPALPERPARRNAKPLPRSRKAAPVPARIPAPSLSPEMAVPAPAKETGPPPSAGGPPRRAGWQLGSYTPASLRKAIILSEILAPPLALREVERR